jgi:hypothetical protein
MRCIICHSDSIGFEILAMCRRYRKGLIAYQKCNEITSMKKHVEDDHSAFMKTLVEDPSCIAKVPTDQSAK